VILLLDAHALLWWLADAAELSDQARRAIADPANEVLVSAASIWEIEVKRAAGRLEAPAELLEDLDRARIDALPLTAIDAVAAARLPLHHRDPFDRMVVAQAQRLDAIVVSRDRAFEAYDVPVLPA
jgi:PIN domain nuclease of toxin-antitoxin system